MLFHALKTREHEIRPEDLATGAANIKNGCVYVKAILAFRENAFSHHTIPVGARAAHPRTQAHTHLCCLQSALHQEPCLPSMAVRQKNSPPPLLFSQPSLSVPEKARNVRAAQFNQAQSETVLLRSSFYYFIGFFFCLSHPLLCFQPRATSGAAWLWSAASVNLLTVKKNPQINPQNHKNAAWRCHSLHDIRLGWVVASVQRVSVCVF